MVMQLIAEIYIDND